jgi:hypothetical protein
MSLKGPCILAWFWVKFPEHLCPYVYIAFLAQVIMAKLVMQLIMADIPCNDSIFYIQDEMYNKPQGLLTTFTVPGIDRILL